MSEQSVATAEATEAVEVQGEPADKPLGPNGEKALAAERAARKSAETAAADLQAKLDKIEQANLTELEKAQRAATEARAQLEQITRQNTRNAVALTKGVPADLVEFLTGDTEEQIAAKADVLMARLNAPKTPLPDATQGAKGGAHALNSDPLLDALKSKLGID